MRAGFLPDDSYLNYGFLEQSGILETAQNWSTYGPGTDSSTFPSCGNILNVARAYYLSKTGYTTQPPLTLNQYSAVQNKYIATNNGNEQLKTLDSFLTPTPLDASVPEQGPDDVLVAYSSMSIHMAGIVLMRAYLQLGRGSDPTPEQRNDFTQWCNSILFNDLKDKNDQDEKVQIVYDADGVYPFFGGVMFAKNRFFLEIAKLIYNRGKINDKQIIDLDYMDKIYDFESTDAYPNKYPIQTTLNVPERWQKVNGQTSIKYYRGIWGVESNSSGNRPPYYNPVYALSGLAGIRIYIGDNYISAVFRRGIPDDAILTTDYNYPKDIDPFVLTQVLKPTLFNAYSKTQTILEGYLDTYQTWNTYIKDIEEKYVKYEGMFPFVPPSVDNLFYGNYHRSLAVIETLIGDRLAKIAIPALEPADGAIIN